MYTGNLRQNEDVRSAKHFLTNISNRHSERYYYPDGMPRYSIIQMDSIQAMDVIERLIEHVENLEASQVKKEVGGEVRKTKRPFFTRQKTLANGMRVTYVPWWMRPIAVLFSK